MFDSKRLILLSKRQHMRKHYKHAVCILTFVLLVIGCSTAHSQVYVKGYTRKDGTYVRPHYRSAPDGKFYNNWSTKGNVNPYTGEPGTKLSPSAGSASTGGEYLFLSDQIDDLQKDHSIGELQESLRRLDQHPSDSPSPHKLALPSSLQDDVYPQREASNRSAGMLGQRFFSLEASFSRPDDEFTRLLVGDVISEYSLELNLPITEFLDFRSSLAFLSAQSEYPFYLDYSGMSFGGNLIAHFQPGKSIDPFVFGGLSYLYLAGEDPYGYREEMDAVGYKAGVGLQLSVSDRIAFTPYFAASGESANGNFGSSVGGTLNLWGGDSLLLLVDVEKSFGDNSSVELSGSFGFKF